MKPWAAVLAAIVLCAALYLPYLGALELRGEEPRRILPARNMIESGDWIVPRIGGSVYRKKPPLINWSIAAAFLATGTRSDWAARLPSVLWLTAFAVTATLALRRRLGDWGALSTGLFFVSTIAMMDKGRTAEIEAMYASQTGIAYVLWAAWWSQEKRWWAWTIPWIFLGLGMLTKGPVHLALFYLLLIPTLVFSRRLKDLWCPPHLTGLVIMTAVFLPWMLLNLQLTSDPGKTTGVWAGEAAERFRLVEIAWKSWLIRPFQVVIDLLPWTPLMLFAWWRTRPLPIAADRPPEQERWDSVIRGARWGVLVGLIILLLLPHGTARYCQPLFPALCLLLVDHWGRLDHRTREGIDQRWAHANHIAGWLAAGLAVIAAGLVPKYLGGGWTPGALAAIAAGFIALLPNLCARRKLLLTPLVHSCVVMATFAGVGLLHAGVYLDQHGDLRQNGRAMNVLLSDSDRPLVFYRMSYFRSVHYLRRPYREIDAPSELRPGAAYLVMPQKSLSSEAVRSFLQTHRVTELARPTWEEKQLAILQIDP